MLVAGAHDPLFAARSPADRVDYHPAGTRPGLAALRAGDADAAVLAAPADRRPPVPAGAAAVATWRRSWGLVVPAGNPAGVDGLGALVDRPLTLRNRSPATALRTALSLRVAGLAAERGWARHDVVAAVDGYGSAAADPAGPVAAVAADRADAGLAAVPVAAGVGAVETVPLGVQRLALAVAEGVDPSPLPTDPSGADRPGYRSAGSPAGEAPPASDGAGE